MGVDSTDGVRIEVRGRTAHVLLDRPQALNALSPALLEGLQRAVATATEAGCSVLVLRSSGPALSAGADLRHLKGLLDDRAAVDDYIGSIGRAFDALEAAPFVSVCVVDGYAVAGGCELMLACDLVVASSSAKIGDRHQEYGLLPGAGGSVRLARALPAALARRLFYTGEMIDGDTAADWGLVGWSSPPDQLDELVSGLVARLERHSPEALAQMKVLWSRALDADRRGALDAEVVTVVRHLVDSADAHEGLNAFAERRQPVFGSRAGAPTVVPS